MEFRTVVDIPDPGFRIGPCESMLFVGSCFADSIGRRFLEEKFRAVVNPFGVMYNPASILHTIERLVKQGDGSFVTSAGVTKEPSPCFTKRSMVWRMEAGLYITPKGLTTARNFSS